MEVQFTWKWFGTIEVCTSFRAVDFVNLTIKLYYKCISADIKQIIKWEMVKIVKI